MHYVDTSAHVYLTPESVRLLSPPLHVLDVPSHVSSILAKLHGSRVNHVTPAMGRQSLTSHDLPLTMRRGLSPLSLAPVLLFSFGDLYEGVTYGQLRAQLAAMDASFTFPFDADMLRHVR